MSVLHDPAIAAPGPAAEAVPLVKREACNHAYVALRDVGLLLGVHTPSRHALAYDRPR